MRAHSRGLVRDATLKTPSLWAANSVLGAPLIVPGWNVENVARVWRSTADALRKEDTSLFYFKRRTSTRINGHPTHYAAQKPAKFDS
eukprot:6916546-Prymnesium_polylepis.2